MTDTKTLLARLEPVSVRDIWPDEAQDFTPWLAQEENLALLGKTLDMDLELESTEVPVGSFSADIVAAEVDSADNRKVLIENQLEKTDHAHLGQILTYAAGLDALTVVWIAKRFTDEHRAALEWLNAVTGADIRFFGLEIEVWRIGDSSRAPKFNIVAQPNDWTKSITPTAELTPTRQAQLDFWRGFHTYATDHPSSIRPTTPKAHAYMSFAIGRGGFGLAAVASTWSEQTDGPELRAEFVIHGAKANAHFETLRKDQDQIHQKMSEELEWHSPSRTRKRKVLLRGDIDWQDPELREDCYVWLIERLDRLYQVFHDKVRQLP